MTLSGRSLVEWDPRKLDAGASIFRTSEERVSACYCDTVAGYSTRRSTGIIVYTAVIVHDSRSSMSDSPGLIAVLCVSQ